jgi:hypothetical protein
MVIPMLLALEHNRVVTAHLFRADSAKCLAETNAALGLLVDHGLHPFTLNVD